jgi:3-hydroxyisobutyrate dehydrogenase-like beta-hydroxyacid dehydrogenase
MAVIGVIAQGEMGVGVGHRLGSHGHKILTVLEGRSAASANRAAAAGMTAVSWEAIVGVDLFISLVPPSEAQPLAQRLAPLLKAAQARPLYADLNAISPNTARAIADILTEAGCTVADGGVCGAPPAPGAPGPAIYTSGPGAKAFGAYRQYGLDIRVMDAPIGAASAVKICQSGFTKGYTALASVVALAAMRLGVGETLREELLATRAGLIEFVQPATLRMFDKAHRYVGEMGEIADSIADETEGRQIFEAFGEVYRHLAKDREGPNRDIALLRQFYEGKQEPTAG